MTDTSGPPPTTEQPPAGYDAPPPGFDRFRARHYEQLRRSATDRKIAGVAGGLGRHLDIDPTVLRVVLVVLCFFGGSGFLLYGAAWLLVPEDGQDTGTVAVRPSTRNALLGGAVVLAALLVLGDSWGGVGFPWPLLVVGLGVLGYLAFRDRDASSRPVTAGGHYASAVGPPAPAYDAGSTDLPQSSSVGTAYPEPPPWLAEPPVAPDPPSHPKSGPLLFGYTVALLAVALGALGLYDASGGPVVDSAYPALALGVIGLMLVVGSVVGRAGGLILLGVLAAGALAVTSLVGAAGGWPSGDGKQLSVTPLSASAVQDSYYVSEGRIVLDLSELRDPSALAGRSVDVGARAGELVVVLPRGIVTEVDADISGPGQVDLPDSSSGGLGSHLSESYGSGSGTFAVDARLFAGHIDVRTQ
ncbi:MAG TPA: PspC domain-containing protein [Nocardioidaceae bacterium]|nr:PspC domain-containing protein [Nocardioidaceae bacterium]